MKYTGQAGDTIIEVLLAMAVVSAIIGGGYASARSSLNTTLQSRERDQAVTLTQSQAELLRAAVNISTLNIASKTTLFCLDGQGTPPSVALFPMTATALGSLDTFTPSTYNNPQCVRNGNNAPYTIPTATTTPFYVSIKRDPDGGDDNLYEIATRWNRIGGAADQVIIRYRVY